MFILLNMIHLSFVSKQFGMTVNKTPCKLFVPEVLLEFECQLVPLAFR